MKFKDITGKKFGRLSVVSFIERKNLHTHWNCICDCGNKVITTNNNLSTGHTKSCGCYQRDEVRKRLIKHGMRNTKFFTIWASMRQRCRNKNCPDFKRYGERGIKVCERWNTFLNFKDDMHKSYLKHIEEFGEKDTTIDRINNNGNYSKENCRWATHKEQARNRRNNYFISYKGKVMCLASWAEITKLPQALIWQRIKRDKWPSQKVFNTSIY